MSVDDPSEPAYYRPEVTAALDAAGDAAAVEAFLAYMAEHYVGDYYIEGSLQHLLTMVRTVRA